MAESYASSTDVIVLRPMMDEAAARALIERKKQSLFGSLLSQPKAGTVRLQKIQLSYECLRTVSGRYEADYMRNATYTITVDKSVRRVVVGDTSFDLRQQSRLKKVLSPRRGKNKIDIDLQEHVAFDSSLEITFDTAGNEIKRPKYKVSPETTEARPESIINDEALSKKPSLEREDAVSILEERLKSPLEPDIEDLSEQFDLDSIVETYVPIFEARVRGPDNKAAIIRIDAARKKII